MPKCAQTELPDVIITDSGPLIRLAKAEALGLLHLVGRRVFVTDATYIEATSDLSTPGANELLAWFKAGASAASNAAVTVEETQVGRAFTKLRADDPRYLWPHASELSMIEWLRDRVDRSPVAIVLYENGKAPRMLGDADASPDIEIVNTLTFLRLAEGRGFIPSAEACWDWITAGN